MDHLRLLQRFVACLVSVSLLVGCLDSRPATPVPQEPTSGLADSEPLQPTPTPDVPADVPVPIAWDFAGEQGALGWSPTNHLVAFSVGGQGLETRAIGGDPYMAGPRIELAAADALYLEIQMRSTKGADAQVFWEVDGRAFNEADSMHFTVIPDGEWHTYRLALKDSPNWTGTITRLRLDPSNAEGGDIGIALIRALGPFPGVLAVDAFGPARGVLEAGRPFAVTAVVRNAGDRSLEGRQVALETSDGLEVIDGSERDTPKVLGPGELVTLTWELQGEPGSYPLWFTEGDRLLHRTDTVIALDEVGAEDLSLQSSQISLTFLREPFGYGVGTVRWYDGHDWKIAGRLRSLGEIRYLDAEGEEQRTLLYATGGSFDDDRLVFEATYTDEDGTTWTCRVTFTLENEAPWFRASYEIAADHSVSLLAWTGPEYLAGESSFGDVRETGMFPGLEFLMDEEQSSGTDFVDPPASVRYVPHPNKVTIPLMSVSQNGFTTGLIWDPLQRWDGSHDTPAALYASPNTWQHQANHLMRLFVPGASSGLRENEDQLREPYQLEAEQPLRLDARLFVAPADDLLAPLDVYFMGNSLPQLPEMPFTYAEAISLSLESYTDTTWAPNTRGWHYTLADPWGPGSNPAIALHLWLATLEEGVQAGTVTRYRELISASQALSPAGGQPNTWFYEPTLAMHLATEQPGPGAIKELMLSKVSGQAADGSWPFTPINRSGRPFGEAGNTSSGWVATFAFPILYAARITGDRTLAESGMRALAYLEEQPLRPEGAQTWELSLQVPDILGSAWAVQAFVEGYRLTGETRYLEQAQRWAYSGLPFVYLWNAPDRELMAYATIPVFGASNYTFPWFGKPVMWNGLDYAIGLQGLAQELDREGMSQLLDWRRIAEGITIASMQMQATEGPFKGMYPDAWDVVQGEEAYSWWLAPTYLLHNILLLQDEAGAKVHTFALPYREDGIRLSTVAEVMETSVADGVMRVKLSYHANDATTLLIAPLRRAPEHVYIDGEEVSQYGDWEAPAGAWYFRQGMLSVRVPFATAKEAVVEITLP